MHHAMTLLADQVRAATADRTPLCIRGGGTKDFYGNPPHGELLDTRGLNGIVAYEPTELFVTVLAGTPLAEVERTLAEQGQMLAFEPPHFGRDATVGGCIAAGLAGPRRASFGTTYGSVRDFVLGTKLLNARGDVLAFGGNVMKNVAGYDVSRLLAGSLGVLGVIVEVSLKVLPVPEAECTLRFDMDETQALGKLNAWGREPLPISASAWQDNVVTLRLSGSGTGVQSAHGRLGGDVLEPEAAHAFWLGVREQTDPFFAGDAPLWRLSLPSTAGSIASSDSQLIEWGGALRWIRSELPIEAVRARARELGGHATLFKGGDRSAGVFMPLTATVATLHKRLKAEFDPAGIFNPGRMYEDAHEARR